jgi:hypothetical protein
LIDRPAGLVVAGEDPGETGKGDQVAELGRGAVEAQRGALATEAQGDAGQRVDRAEVGALQAGHIARERGLAQGQAPSFRSNDRSRTGNSSPAQR